MNAQEFHALIDLQPVLDWADARARTAGRVYSVRRHRKAHMLELAVGWADR